MQNRVAQAVAQLPTEAQQNGVRCEAGHQPDDGGKPLLTEQHPHAAVRQQLRQHRGARRCRVCRASGR
ncbi:hypothetical protein ACVXG7_08965 [Enterobacter hormaechei]